MFQHIILLLCLMSTFASVVYGCQCEPITYNAKNGIFDSDVTFRFKVTGERIALFNDQVFYPIRITKIYKSEINLNHIKRVYTPESSATCGATLVVEQEYIYHGSVEMHRFNLGSCDNFHQWSKVSSSNLKYLDSVERGNRIDDSNDEEDIEIIENAIDSENENSEESN